MSLLEKAKRLVGRGRPKLATSAVDRSKIEGAILRDMRKRAPVLNDAITTPPESATAASWDELANDVWSTYFGEREPRLRPRDEMDPAYHVNREVVNRHIRSEEYENEHPRTAGKPVPSALGCVGALNSLRESYENELKEHADRAKEVEQAQDDLDRIDEYLSELRETRELATPEGQEEIDEKIREAANEKRTTLATCASSASSSERTPPTWPRPCVSPSKRRTRQQRTPWTPPRCSRASARARAAARRPTPTRCSPSRRKSGATPRCDVSWR
jgi:hypothetical protein